jgi:hypothetical protein
MRKGTGVCWQGQRIKRASLVAQNEDGSIGFGISST